ncbi:MAG: hypothetical protein AAF846_17125 [Chloroflexota bacterium]
MVENTSREHVFSLYNIRDNTVEDELLRYPTDDRDRPIVLSDEVNALYVVSQNSRR